MHLGTVKPGNVIELYSEEKEDRLEWEQNPFYAESKYFRTVKLDEEPVPSYVDIDPIREPRPKESLSVNNILINDTSIIRH